ncbi:MAG: HAMP domain-containing histidine kinase [Clostridioides sp.]|jgi:signal transduction histidine kinase|nr:HAMP domain-containing histidine kinase [Clostridioides sp.]
MFKSLRNKIMMFNILTISFVILVAFAVIYLVTYTNLEMENDQRLQTISRMFFLPNRDITQNLSGYNPLPINNQERFSADYSVSFVLFTKNGNLQNINSQLNFEDRVYEEAYEKIGTKSSGKITLEGRKWKFTKISENKINNINEPEINNNENVSKNINTKESQINNYGSVSRIFNLNEQQINNNENVFKNENKSLAQANQFDDYTRIVFLDITHTNEILKNLVITLICVGFFVLLIIVYISYRFSVRAVAPVEESHNKQKTFIADASHEFKTPLAIIGANIDAIISSKDETVESQSEWFGYIHSELKRATRLVDDLLYLVRTENTKKEDYLPFDLSEICEKVSVSIEAILYDNNKTLKSDIEKDIVVVADSEKITQVLYILLDNAKKYTNDGGEIFVKLAKEDGNAVMKVINSGVDISKEDLPKIFDRFYRTDTSRSTETGGFGLGLSIAKEIVERADGKITADSKDGFTTFTVNLPYVKNKNESFSKID